MKPIVLTALGLGVAQSSMCVVSPTVHVPIVEDPCDVYCHGDLLLAVQLNTIYDDGKHFVDMPMKVNPSVITADFQDFMRLWNISSDRLGSLSLTESGALKMWVEERFNEPGSDLFEAGLDDWVDEPPILASIKNESLRQFAKV